MKEPTLVVYKDEDFKSAVSLSSYDDKNSSTDSQNAVGRIELLRRNGWCFLHIYTSCSLILIYFLNEVLIVL